MTRPRRARRSVDGPRGLGRSDRRPRPSGSSTRGCSTGAATWSSGSTRSSGPTARAPSATSSAIPGAVAMSRSTPTTASSRPPVPARRPASAARDPGRDARRRRGDRRDRGPRARRRGASSRRRPATGPGRGGSSASFWTAPGLRQELMHLYLATDLEPAHPDERLGPDEDEHLALERVPFADALAAADRGEIARREVARRRCSGSTGCVARSGELGQTATRGLLGSICGRGSGVKQCGTGDR